MISTDLLPSITPDTNRPPPFCDIVEFIRLRQNEDADLRFQRLVDVCVYVSRKTKNRKHSQWALVGNKFTKIRRTA